MDVATAEVKMLGIIDNSDIRTPSHVPVSFILKCGQATVYAAVKILI